VKICIGLRLEQIDIYGSGLQVGIKLVNVSLNLTELAPDCIHISINPGIVVLESTNSCPTGIAFFSETNAFSLSHAEVQSDVSDVFIKLLMARISFTDNCSEFLHFGLVGSLEDLCLGEFLTTGGERWFHLADSLLQFPPCPSESRLIQSMLSHIAAWLPKTSVFYFFHVFNIYILCP
jgi:hypothetical protein